MTRKSYECGRIFIGRLPKGADLVASLTRIANEEGIKVGTVVVHGIVERLSLSLHDPATRMPVVTEREGPAEIANVSGTISLFKGRSMVRLNGAFVDDADHTMIGGVVALGTIVYACEAVITELVGGTLSRDFDMETGLPLWKSSAMLVDGGAPGAEESSSS